MFYLPHNQSIQEHEEDATTWIALSDLMTGLMAIFLVLSIAILVNHKNEQVAVIRDVEEVLKAKDIKVTYDVKTGNVNIPTDFAFEFGKANLTPNGKIFLNTFIPVYAEAIFKNLPEKKQAIITRLVVEGHTDSIGSYTHNMKLSSERANAVVTYIDLEMPPFPHKQQLLQKLTAVGRGENDTTQDNIANPEQRKVVFRFDFKQFDLKNEEHHINENIKPTSNITSH